MPKQKIDSPIKWSFPQTSISKNDDEQYSLVEVGDDFITIYYGSEEKALSPLPRFLKEREPTSKMSFFGTVEEEKDTPPIPAEFYHMFRVIELHRTSMNPKDHYHDCSDANDEQNEMSHMHLKFESYRDKNHLQDGVKSVLAFCEKNLEGFSGLVVSYDEFINKNDALEHQSNDEQHPTQNLSTVFDAQKFSYMIA